MPANPQELQPLRKGTGGARNGEAGRVGARAWVGNGWVRIISEA